ncbi:MAG: UDP-3-O-(3-hydroxymyristoyl)glucosamine N-acyltransferase [Xanthobacteraceae bacterium]
MAHALERPVSSACLANALGAEHCGREVAISYVGSHLDNDVDNCIYFTKKYAPSKSGNSIVIAPDAISDHDAIIRSSNPRLTFARALRWILDNCGISTWNYPAKISSTATIGKNVVLHPGIEVGPHVVIEDNVVIHPGTRIGARTRIRASSSVGGDGFGFERDLDGTPVRIPHLGGVHIASDVEIGSLCSVVRGTLVDTVIEEHVKTDNLVHIAHNCRIGAGSLLTACCELSGGVQLGKQCWVGPNASIMQKVAIGEGAFIGIGAVILKDIEPRTVWAGNPARMIRRLTS